MVNNSSELARRTSQAEPGLNPGNIKEDISTGVRGWRVVQRAESPSASVSKSPDNDVQNDVQNGHDRNHLIDACNGKNGILFHYRLKTIPKCDVRHYGHGDRDHLGDVVVLSNDNDHSQGGEDEH